MISCATLRRRYRRLRSARSSSLSGGPSETPCCCVNIAGSRGTRIATNVYEILEAAAGKPVFFFPARFDLPTAQASDGYAYKVAVEGYIRDPAKANRHWT